MPSFSVQNPEYRKINRRRAVNAEHVAPMTRHPDVFERQLCGALAQGTREGNSWRTETDNGWLVDVTRFRENLLRVRYAPRDRFDDTPTYALPEGTTPAEESLTVHDDGDRFRFACAAGQVVLAKADGQLSAFKANGDSLLEAQGAPYALRSIMAGTVEVGCGFEIENEAFHGLGDKPGHLDMRGNRYTLWNSDSFGYDHRSDAIYKSIPFILADRGGEGRIGLFFDNPRRSTFDFGREDNDRFAYAAAGGDLVVYLFLEQDPVEICAAYCRLTGTPDLPPLWAIGYQQCRWSYYPEARVREVVAGFRDREIPCDAIYLDIDYMENYKCFTWSDLLFPNLKEMVNDFREIGMRTVVMIDPGISNVPDYDVVESGDAIDAWCRRTNGELMRGPVWPEDCKFPDYTKASVREWWAGLYDELYRTVGISGFWNDMNEPAVFKVTRATFPDEVYHDMDGHGATHAEAHNIYGLKMTEASLAGLKQSQPDVRPFLLTRATYAGGQRYAACWTGDNTATWRHLRTANHQCIRLSLSGFSLSGSDIGGFAGDPSGELYTRWIELAVFHPVMRTHSMGSNADGSTQTDQEAVAAADETDRRDQEPWSFGEPFTTHCREAIGWRYRLLPTLYTALEALHRRGTPVLVPGYMDDPTDRRLVDRDSFRFGEHIFVDPVLKEGQVAKRSYLPAGIWYHLQTGERFAGGTRVRHETPLGAIPAFVRGGAVLQLDPVRQHTAAPYPSAPELHVFHTEGRTTSHLYLDAGEGYDFERGGYLRCTFEYAGTLGGSSLQVEREGSYAPPFQRYTLVWHLGDLSDAASLSLEVDGEPESVKVADGELRAEVPVDFTQLSLARS